MKDSELLEWMGLTVADVLTYLAGAAVLAMFFSRDPIVDLVLAGMAALFALGSCPLGMKPDPEFSRLTNVVKLVSYPAVVLIVCLFIWLHYMFWQDVNLVEPFIHMLNQD